jgi:hypothetical protein
MAEYVYEPVVLAQFTECIQLPASKLIARLACIRDEKDHISEEALVMLARAFHKQEKDALAWKIILAVCERVQPSIVRSAKLWRLTPVNAEGFMEALLHEMYTFLLSDAESEVFWEIKFWVCFERRLLSTLRKFRLRDDRTLETETIEKPSYDYFGASGNSRLEFSDPVTRAIIAEGLAQLPGNLRTAFMLKHWAGYPEHSSDPNEKYTIAQVMEVSDRTVRNYLARAEQLLCQWRDGKIALGKQQGLGSK